jgi:uncharacterized protein YdhG (YjbR/CyaY superfamily)
MHEDVAAYIDGFPAEVAERLRAVRAGALEVVPEHAEKISYGVPTITSAGKNVFHYAAFASHLSTYPVPDADGELAEWIASRRHGKGTLHHPHDQPLEVGRIAEVARLLAEQRRA